MGAARRPCREAQAYRSWPISAVGLAQAREKAAEAIRQLEKGQDPTRKGRARLKAEIEAQTYTFKRAVDEYLAEAAPTLKHPKSEAGRTRGLKAICAHLNDRLVEEIGTREIAAILKSLAPGTADRTRTALNGVFAFAAVAMERRGVLMRNPVSSDLLKAAGYAKTVSHGRQPALSYLELPTFLSEVAKSVRPQRAAWSSLSRQPAAPARRASPNTATSISRRGYGASRDRT